MKKLILCSLTLFAFITLGAKLQAKVRLSPAFNFKFKSPLFMEEFPLKIMGKRAFLVIEKRGLIYLAQHKREGNQRKIIYNIRRKVATSWEEGLLGLAIDPQYSKNHRIYIYYSRSRPRRSVISRLIVKPVQKSMNSAKMFRQLRFKVSEKVLLQIRQPFSNHNGGMLTFGPDGYLYIGVGDGGSAGDPYGHAQNTKTLLGTILRIDVNTDKKYKIPLDNPFIHQKSKREEIYAYGLRNPWRFSIDQKTRRMLAGDVGQNLYEEISIIEKGGNYGWNRMEGFACYRPKKHCNQKGLIKPLIHYGHEEGRSILGGYVYRGNIKWLYGKYIFADSISGTIWSLAWRKPKSKKKTLINTPFFISSFAVDKDNQLYVLDLNSGNIFQLFDD